MMANYVAHSRTNYFEVKDIHSFREELDKYEFEDLEIWKDEADEKIALGGNCDITFMEPIEDGEGEEDEGGEDVSLASIIQRHIAEDDACILTVAGHEKLRYIVAYTLLVTSNVIEYFLPQQMAIDRAKTLINEFETEMEY